ncbi:DEAD/DEAH box helicase family protein [Bradyrhizobium sp. AZCC 2230]|uniref:DEAD/DEAH box helicase family protein n=1 Tax=Bradyrhizobium sp. AZCC 2230 TaxID=3117021 RepID=UPI002FF338AB
MIDFNNLRKPDARTTPTDPREIFKRRPSGEGVANDLWRGQAEALEGWFKDQKDETLILLNTGAGKTIIGLLIAQSLVAQGTKNVVYVCSTIDLIKQTAAEAAKLGIPVTIRAEGDFDNDLFSQGKAFCIATYPALFFGFRANKPGALIFDDAHVAGKSIRDVFTLSITKKGHSQLYAELREFLRPIFTDYHQKMEFEAAIRENEESGTILLSPPCATFDMAGKLSSVINPHINEKDRSLFFPWPFVRDHLKYCGVFVGRGTVEITPPFLPTLTLPAFSRDVKRVYLSATINSRADFTRVFGHKPDKTIAPDVDAGDGERLFVFASKFESSSVDKAIVRNMAEQSKVLIGAPSRHRGKQWDFAIQPTTKTFRNDLDRFRRQTTGAFVLAGRFDGIDLPGAQCRSMVVDGLPSGSNLIEQYLFEKLQMDQLRSNTLSVRITQLLGRIIRGRQDFGFFIVADRPLENWLKNERNRAQLPELLRRQLFLSEAIEDQVPGKHTKKSIIDTMNKVISRDAGWVNYYRDNINDMDVPKGKLQENEQNNLVLEKAGKSEVRFMTKLWDNDPEGAAKDLEEEIREVAIVDPMLAGWYSIWAGVAYYAANKTDAAYDLFDEARRRIGRNLPLPRRAVSEIEKKTDPQTLMEEAVRQIVLTDLAKINDRIAKARILAKNAFSNAAPHKQCEEAVRAIGATLGFVSTRPCTDHGKGPDNLWLDSHSKQMIAFELKTDKTVQSTLSKDDVGQGHNHIEWLKTHYPNTKLHGLIFLTDAQKVSDKSDPSEMMYFGTQAQLLKVWEEFFTAIDRIKTLSPMEKLAEADKVGTLPEWNPEGIFRRLIAKSCKS